MTVRSPDGSGSRASHQAAARPDHSASIPSAERIADLELALERALDLLICFEPPDSRAVSDEFVAMAAICCGLTDRRNECRQIIRDAIAAAARQGGDVQQAPGEAPQSGPDSGIAQGGPHD